MTYFRAGRTIIGPGCLSAVFGMGTGVSTQVWSPACSRQLGGCDVIFWWGGVYSWPGSESGGPDDVAKRSTVSTGPLRTLLPLHSQPIDPVVSRESHGNLILGGVSRLYAFSVYPFRTWLPSGAASATTGTPEVRPSQSSRTREKAPQVSYAHSR